MNTKIVKNGFIYLESLNSFTKYPESMEVTPPISPRAITKPLEPSSDEISQ
jgi:hypothetical protein